MKKSLLALAALTAFAGAASAQSSVTLYGRVDISANKNFGRDDYRLTNGSGSRFGVRGVEDLGGGLQAIFQIEHRFNADTGADSSGGTRFWGARSIVGLQGKFGTLTLGRDYTTAFLQSQLPADPWGWDTSNSTATSAITGGNIAKVRNDSAITYTLGIGGFKIGGQYAEATDEINNFYDNPYNGAISYNAGPISASLAYEFTGNKKEDWTTANLAWNFGFMKIGGFYGTGTHKSGLDVESWMATITAPIGAGEFRLAYGERKVDGDKDIQGLLVGYHYSLSKRTTVYADYGYNDKQKKVNAINGRVAGTVSTSEKDGWDVGIKHNF
jgi:predicted porin